MAKFRSKRYKQAAEAFDKEAKYGLKEAVALLKGFPAPKFDGTVTLSFKLAVDPRKSDQMVRGTCALPHGTGKNVRVIVFAQGEAAKAAEAAGADKVGYEDLIKEVQGGFTDFDAAIATPDAMAEVRKIARVLGPRGLMPNPKTGTVTDDTASAINALKAGRIDFKVDKNANVAGPVGKASFDADKIEENAALFLETMVKAKPSGAKGNYILSATLSSSMSPGVKLDPSLYTASAE